MRRQNPILALVVLLACVVSGQPSSFELPYAPQERQIRWTTKSIQIALSTSLTASSPAIKPDSDVVGAVERALASWSRASKVTFVQVSSKAQSVSPVGRGDGVSLITIAGTTENLSMFEKGNNTARTRVFFDQETGSISEADIVINPYPFSETGSTLQFSTDGTPGTYDLESTLAHEIGHLLGLGHSRVIGATMQASQALNGTYGLPAITERKLSESDETAIRSLYGAREKTDKAGSIEGRIQSSNGGSLVGATAAHVWLEDLTTGKVIASSLTSAGGRFTISDVAPGDYRAMVEYFDAPATEAEALSAATERRAGARQRAFRSVEISGRVRVVAEKNTTLNYVLVPPQNSAPALSPRFIGTNGELSLVPVPVTIGKRVKLYVSGEGMDLIPGTGLTVSSPLVTVDPASLSLEQFNLTTPVISFDVIIAADVPPGDYTIRMQANSGEVAYLVGCLKVEPAN